MLRVTSELNKLTKQLKLKLVTDDESNREHTGFSHVQVFKMILWYLWLKLSLISLLKYSVVPALSFVAYRCRHTSPFVLGNRKQNSQWQNLRKQSSQSVCLYKYDLNWFLLSMAFVSLSVNK